MKARFRGVDLGGKGGFFVGEFIQIDDGVADFAEGGLQGFAVVGGVPLLRCVA